MNCTEYKELLVAYVEGLLEDSEKQAIADHLKDCSSCRSQVEEIRSLHDRLVTNGKVLAQSDLVNNVMNQIVREQNVRLKTAVKATEALKTRRTIMKSPIARIAVAAAVVVVAALGINFIMKPSVTWAQVVEPILNAKTIAFDLLIGDEQSGLTMHDIVVGSRIRRTMSNMPNMTQIIDMDNAKLLGLDTEAKTAVYVDIKGDLADRTRSYIEFVRQVIRQLQEGQVQELGEQTIDGQKAIGFVGKGQNEEVTIWADPQTALPIRIEAKIGQEFSFVMKNFQFNTPVDESTVSMDVPEGYTPQKSGIDLGNANEADFIESLRIWAEIIGDGVFPQTIGTQSTMKVMPTLVQKLTAMKVTEQEGTRLGMTFAKGMLFHQILEGQGQWTYAGAGVKFGDAKTAIFWYQPKDSATWRVIYGDLSVKDVAPENLPK